MWEWIVASAAALKIEVSVLVSSAVGGFISLNFFEGTPRPDGTIEPLSRKQKWSVVLAGAAMGTYGASLVVELLALASKGSRIEVAIGLLIGIFGMSVAASVVKAVRGLDFKGIVESWFKRG